jgi:hypothetical protein
MLERYYVRPDSVAFDRRGLVPRSKSTWSGSRDRAMPREPCSDALRS